MTKVLMSLFGLCLCALRPETVAADFQALSGPERVAYARAARGEVVRGYFAKAGVEYPPKELLLRAFKTESILEVWARNGSGPLVWVHSYPVLASSGVLGPKMREGDMQVPEGFYQVDRFNPASRFHLSLGINYPNATDMLRVDREQPGSDIYIHGGNLTIGCLPIGDDGMEELFITAIDTRDNGGKPIKVHIFPAKMQGPLWDKIRAEAVARNPALEKFWQHLAAGNAAFEAEQQRLKKVAAAKR